MLHKDIIYKKGFTVSDKIFYRNRQKMFLFLYNNTL